VDGRTRKSVRLVSLRAANDAAIATEAADKAIRSSHRGRNRGGLCCAARGLARLGYAHVPMTHPGLHALVPREKPPFATGMATVQSSPI